MNTSTDFNEFSHKATPSFEYFPVAYALDDEGETTGFSGLNGAATNYVIHKKGWADGKGISNGLYVGCDNAYTVAPSWCTHTGVEAYEAAKGNSTDNINPKAKKMAFADQNSDYVVNDTTDTTGLKGMKGVAVVAIAPVDTTITKEWDAETAADEVKTQIATFGAKGWSKFGPTTEADIVNPDGIKTKGKYEAKMAALDKTLNAAFTGEGTHNAKFIDTTMDVSWYPKTEDPMDALIEEENETEAMIAKAKAALSVDQWAMVLAKAGGKTQKEIAADLGVTPAAVCLKWKTIVKKATKATGCAFVA